MATIAINQKNDDAFKRFRQARICKKQLHHVERFLYLHPFRLFLLAVMAGGLICVAANLSLALSVGDVPKGPQNVLMGLGFFAGFGMVILTGAALFTEINVSLPLYLLLMRPKRNTVLRVLLSWLLVWFGNVIGSLVVAAMLAGTGQMDEDIKEYLHQVTEKKVYMYYNNPTVSGWFQVLLSAMLGNWMVGLAAMLASNAETPASQLISIYLPITAFVALGLQHSPANMGYLHLDLIVGDTKMTWASAWIWNIIPASIGNLIGASIFVAGLFYYVFVENRYPVNFGDVEQNDTPKLETEPKDLEHNIQSV